MKDLKFLAILAFVFLCLGIAGEMDYQHELEMSEYGRLE